jgi:hypothetical protein
MNKTFSKELFLNNKKLVSEDGAWPVYQIKTSHVISHGMEHIDIRFAHSKNNVQDTGYVYTESEFS